MQSALPKYSITDLGLLNGYRQAALPISVNDRGFVAGTACCATYPAMPERMAFVYHNGTMTKLGGLAGFSGSYAAGLNALSSTAGDSFTPGRKPNYIVEEHPRAVSFIANHVIDLGTLVNDNASFALGLNNTGDVIGESFFDSPNPSIAPHPSAVIFHNGKVTRLGPGEGILINNSGIAVVATETGKNLVYTPRGSTTLGTLGGPSTQSAAINDAGVIIGSSDLRLNAQHEQISHAFAYVAGRLFDMGTPAGTDPNHTSSQGLGINNLNEGVGAYLLTGATSYRAFVYTGGVMRDLAALFPTNSGWMLDAAYSINDCGDIVGKGSHNGQLRGFLLHRLNKDRVKERSVFGCH